MWVHISVYEIMSELDNKLFDRSRTIYKIHVDLLHPRAMF